MSRRSKPASGRRFWPRVSLSLLHKSLLFGGLIVVLASVMTLSIASHRIEAEQAAFGASPTVPRCEPDAFNVSDVLPGSHIAVSPLPNSYDASPYTQISIVGVPRSAIASITVNGSSSGTHGGSLQAYSQGDGASFVPGRAFDPGETVWVKARLHTAPHSFAFHFVVSHPDEGLFRSARSSPTKTSPRCSTSTRPSTSHHRSWKRRSTTSADRLPVRRPLCGTGGVGADDLRRKRQPRVVPPAAVAARRHQPAGPAIWAGPGADVVAGDGHPPGLRPGRRGDRRQRLPASGGCTRATATWPTCTNSKSPTAARPCSPSSSRSNATSPRSAVRTAGRSPTPPSRKWTSPPAWCAANGRASTTSASANRIRRPPTRIPNGRSTTST